MNTARDFHAREGEPVRKKLNAFARHIFGSARLQTGRHVRVHQYQNGKSIVADLRAPGYSGAFAVSLTDRRVRVGAGVVNASEVPRIAGRPIDGREDGKQKEPPEMKLDEKPGADKRSWICLRARAESGADTPVRFVYDIAHITDPSMISGTEDETGAAHHALAIVLWSENDAPQRVAQIIYFNIRHTRDEESKRHTFKADA